MTQEATSAPDQNSGPKQLMRGKSRDQVPDKKSKPPTPTPAAGPSVPKITHTPATPLKNGDDPSASGSGSAKVGPKIKWTRPGHQAMKGSLDSGRRYLGGGAMGVVDEEGRPDSQMGVKGKGRDNSDVLEGVAIPRPGGIKMSNSARSTKHGSFDFERPGWGASIIQRSGSGGTTESSSGGWGGVFSGKDKSREQEMRERDSTYGPGLAGVGTIQREVSMKRLQEREDQLKEKAKEREREREKERERSRERERQRKPGGVERDREREKSRLTSSTRTTPDHVHGSTSTGATGTSRASNHVPTHGKTSSMSKASGKRLTLGPPPSASALGHAHGFGHKIGRGGSGSGMSRLVGGNHHGLFSFEPAVPSPTRSTGSSRSGTTTTATATGPGYDVGLSLLGSDAWKDKADRERERVAMEKEKQRGARRAKGDRAPVPVPAPQPLPSPSLANLPADLVALAMNPLFPSDPFNPSSRPSTKESSGSHFPTQSNAGYRSGAKGRSLDLGLGLSWAPTKVREDALLPSSKFFARSLSNGSSSKSGSGTGQGMSVGVGRSASGESNGREGGEGSSTGHGSRSGGSRNGHAHVYVPHREVETSRLGREVAELFKNALDGDGYKLFKTCMWLFLFYLSLVDF